VARTSIAYETRINKCLHLYLFYGTILFECGAALSYIAIHSLKDIYPMPSCSDKVKIGSFPRTASAI
jgi:hypothetical protein